ncbi:MAG: peptidylprolyl isomerase [Verrucomicrobia bacterium]|nr:peptidylprolyl isomerase [Verrucomicrobiota bacterium]
MIQNGTIVNVHYIGKFTDGTVFDSSEERGTLRFRVGDSQVIPGFEKAVIGKTVGDVIEVQISPEEGYGNVNPELIVNISKDRLPQQLEVGQMLEANFQNGESTSVMVSEIGTDWATLDANHPLAGKDLIFEIQIVSIG